MHSWRDKDGSKSESRITIASIRDVKSTTRYYLLQSSTAAKPAKPTANPPGGSWVKTEPTYTAGSTNSLYFTDLTVFSDDTFAYSDVSLSSSYEAAKTAYNKAVAAQQSIDGMELGGRNLLLNSSFSEDFLKWSNSSHEIVTKDGFSCGHIAGVLATTKNVSQNIFPRIEGDNLNQVYTVSADIKIENYVAGTTNPYLALYVSGKYDNNGTEASLGATYVGGTIKRVSNNLPPFAEQGWVHVTYTFRFLHVPTKMTFYVYSRDWEGDLYYRNIKLERGNKATDWTPAPEDTTQEITDSADLVRTYAESIMEQKADEIQISISTVTGTLTTDIQDTKDSVAATNNALSGSVNALQKRVSDQEDALLDYKHETSTYFRFNATGLNIGKQEDGDESPYSINIDNEKMAFLQNGNEIAYVQYNKMHINAIEAMDRMSVGAASDGGYFDFISTIYGMGVKWRAVTQQTTAAKTAAKLMAKRAAEYIPVQDEDGIFTVDFGGDDE